MSRDNSGSRSEILVFVRPIELIGTHIDALVDLGWEFTDQATIYSVLVLHQFFIATRAGFWTGDLRFAFSVDFLASTYRFSIAWKSAIRARSRWLSEHCQSSLQGQ